MGFDTPLQLAIGAYAGKGNVIFSALTQAAAQSCSYKKVFWNYAANLEENTHAKATLLKSHFGMTVLL